MKPDPGAESEIIAGRAKSLTTILAQSEHVEEVVKESAQDLSTVNTVIKEEIAERGRLPQVVNALEQNEAVESKVRQASEKLSLVNRALETEVRARVMVDYQLAAATEQEEAARHAAFHDALTGLPNRALFNDRLEHGIAQAKRHGWGLAVMFVDLDRFKSVNDAYGHDAGDAVLQATASRLRENTRGDDTVSRHGGDEFLYLLTEIRNESNIAMVAEKIITLIRAPCQVGAHGLDVSVDIGASIGIAIFPKDGTTAEVLIKNADQAMYRAKQEKSGYRFAA